MGERDLKERTRYRMRERKIERMWILSKNRIRERNVMREREPD